MQGLPPEVELAGYDVRSALHDDIEKCNEVCRRVHGHARAGEFEKFSDAAQPFTLRALNNHA
jgi:hypothetical protein